MDKNASPLVSIYVPCFNVEKYLEACIESILAQTYQNIEIVLIDNMSTDSTREIMEKAAESDPRISCITCETPGLSAVRNKAFAALSGEWITTVDADDHVDKDYVSILLKSALDADADISMCNFSVCDGKKIKVRENIKADECLSDRAKIQEFFVRSGKNMKRIWGKLYKRSVLENITFPEGKYYEDLAAMPHILENVNRFCLIRRPLYFYTIHSSSITGRNLINADMDGFNNLLSLTDFYKEKYPELLPYAYDCLFQFGFYTLSHIWAKKYGAYINEARVIKEEIKRSCRSLPASAKKTKTAARLVNICPRAASFIFSIYRSFL